MNMAGVICITAFVVNMVICAFGVLHYRINPKTDVFYNVLLGIGTTIGVCSGVTWIIQS